MKEYKIIEMVDINRKINAIFKPANGLDRIIPEVAYPVIGLVLVEDMEGQRVIKMLIVKNNGLITYLEEDEESFIEIRKASYGIREYRNSDVLL